jgi:hypothetical protein
VSDRQVKSKDGYASSRGGRDVGEHDSYFSAHQRSAHTGTNNRTNNDVNKQKNQSERNYTDDDINVPAQRRSPYQRSPLPRSPLSSPLQGVGSRAHMSPTGSHDRHMYSDASGTFTPGRTSSAASPPISPPNQGVYVVCIRVCMCMCSYLHVYVHVYVYVYDFMHICHVCACTYIFMHEDVFVCVRTCLCLYGLHISPPKN